MMNRGFMGSDVFGGRVGRQVETVRPVFAVENRNFSLSGAGRRSMGQSRTEGVEPLPAAADLCSLLRSALAANSARAEGAEWDDFFSALDRLRPVDKENETWRAEVYHQLALQCPDDVSRLRSIPGVSKAPDKCVKVMTKHNESQDVASKIGPYQSRGWSVVEVPVAPRRPAQVPSGTYPEMKLIQQTEIWACPPGEAIPKKTSLTAQEAADLAKSLDQATGPIRSSDPRRATCVAHAKVDVVITSRLLARLKKAAASNSGVDVSQDEVDAANEVVDCASSLGVKVVPVPETIAPGISTGAAAGIVGSAGALAFLFM